MWWNEYIGIPFAEKGRDRNGVDCWGLVCLVYKELRGIELPSSAEAYASTRDKKTISELLGKRDNKIWLAVDKPKTFDVLLLKIDGVPFHVGLYTHDRKFIHCSRGVGTAVERLESMRWKNNFMGAFRWAK